MNKNSLGLTGKIIGFIIIVVLILVINPIVIIGAGDRGVVFNNFSGIESRVLGEGIHFRVPFVESVTKLSVRTQISNFEESGADSAGTQDSQRVDLKVTINWHLNPTQVNKIYQKVGDMTAVTTNVLSPAVKDSMKAAISHYVALDVQKNRDLVGSAALGLLQEKMKVYDVTIENLSITNINFSDQFNQAIEDAQVQQQKAKAAEYAVVTATNNANAAVAAATGQAKAQALLQQALTPELLQKMAIDKWNGSFPTYFGGGVLPFLNIGK